MSNILSSKQESSSKIKFTDDIDQICRDQIGYHTKIDSIGNFTIDPRSSLIEYSSPIAEAFKIAGDNKSYALVFNRSTPIRLMTIMKLLKTPINNLSNPISIGITTLSHTKKEHICVIMPLPLGQSLTQLITDKDKLTNYEQVVSLSKITNQVLYDLHSQEIIHGAINVGTIYIGENGDIFIGECISALCNSAQHEFFETIHQAQCSDKYTKYYVDKTVDYYALGISIFLYYKKIIYTKYLNNITAKKVVDGTFLFLASINTIQPNATADMIKGLVADDCDIRWGYQELTICLEKKTYSVNNLNNQNRFTRPINFDDKAHYTKASLAYSLYKHWDKAIAFIKQDHIIRWLDISASEQNIVELLIEIRDSKKSLFTNSSIYSYDDEKLIKTLMILDPKGPLRIKDFSFFFQSLGEGLIMAHNNDKNLFKKYLQILLSTLLSFYEYILKKHKLNYSNEMIINYQQNIKNLKKATIGFGFNRCIYDFNPSLPCQSKLLDKKLYIGAADLLNDINDKKIDLKDIILQKDSINFLASRLDIFAPINFSSLSNFPLLVASAELQSLGIMAQGQKKFQLNGLTNLTEAFVTPLHKIFNQVFHSASIKKTFCNAIDNISHEGNLNRMVKEILNLKYSTQDSQGYEQAIKDALTIQYEINSFEDDSKMQQKAYFSGINIAIRMGYILCFILSVIAFFKYF